MEHVGFVTHRFRRRDICVKKLENVFKPLPMALVTVQLICSFDFAFAESRFSHHAAHMSGPSV